MFERHLTGTYIVTGMPDEVQMTNPGGFCQQPDLWVADTGRALLSRHLRQLGGRLQSTPPLVAAYSGRDKTLVQVMLMKMSLPMLMLMLMLMLILPPCQVKTRRFCPGDVDAEIDVDVNVDYDVDVILTSQV